MAAYVFHYITTQMGVVHRVATPFTYIFLILHNRENSNARNCFRVYF